MDYDKLTKKIYQDEITVYLVNDQLQGTEADACEIFQIYIYENLFQPLPNSGILNNKNITKNTFSKLLNEIFSLDKTENKHKLEIFAEENNIQFN